MLLRQLFDRESSTYTYLVADEATGQAALVDPVREQIERDIELLEELDLKLTYVFETHVHADHVTAAGALRQRLGAKTVLSSASGAECADVLVDDRQTLSLGALRIEARHTPGHTDGCVTYVADDGSGPVAFTGDALLIRGCGRTDFQQGDSATLYDSVWNGILSLPDETPIYPGHDYRGRTSSTVGEEKRCNPRLGEDKTKSDFERIMSELRLSHPKKMAVAVPANLRCGIIHDDSWAPVHRTDDGVPEVDLDWVAGGPAGVRIVDVRRPAELEGELGALPGAENVPLDRLADHIDAWDQGERIVVVCRSGGRSGTAARLLEEWGFAHVASMRGGMIAYRASEASTEASGEVRACG